MSSEESQEINTSPLDGLMADQSFQMFLVEQITADLQEDLITNQPNTPASDIQTNPSQAISHNQMNATQPTDLDNQQTQSSSDTQPTALDTQQAQSTSQATDTQPTAPDTQQAQSTSQASGTQLTVPDTQQAQSSSQASGTQLTVPDTKQVQSSSQATDTQPTAPDTQQAQSSSQFSFMQPTLLRHTKNPTGRRCSKRKGYKGETPKAKRSTRSNTLLPNWNKQLDRDNHTLIHINHTIIIFITYYLTKVPCTLFNH